MILPLLSLMLSLHSDVVCPPSGCPDYESQRAAEIDDSLTYIQDSLDTASIRLAVELVLDPAAVLADSLYYVADSLRAIAGATVAAEPMSSIPTDPSAVAHCPEYVARAAQLDALANYIDPNLPIPTDWHSECRPAAHSLARPAEPALVSVATRGNVSEPERATTCYVGLDCPE